MRCGLLLVINVQPSALSGCIFRSRARVIRRACRAALGILGIPLGLALDAAHEGIEWINVSCNSISIVVLLTGRCGRRFAVQVEKTGTGAAGRCLSIIGVVVAIVKDPHGDGP